jgi:Tfp pilus assembly protein PilF
LQHREYDSAISELQKAAQANPRLPFVHFDLGLAYLSIDENEKAQQQFLQDMALEPDLADNYYQLGVVYSRAQDDVRAKSAFEEALKRDPRRAGALFGLGKIYQRQEKYDLALKKMDEALLIVPDSGKVHILRAQLLQKLDRREESRAEFRKAQTLLDAALSKDRDEWGEKMVPSPELKQSPN